MNRSINNSHTSILHKLSRKMILQACLIALVAILGVGVASVVIEQFLLREALSRESDHYWNNYQQDASFNIPNTANLKGYLTDFDSVEGVPENLLGYGLGYHKIHGQVEHSLLYVSEKNGKRFHLLFDGERVTRLAIFFGIFPLTIMLIIIYVTAWWIYRQSNYILSPIVWLSAKLDRFDPAHPNSSIEDLADIPGDVDWEVEKLVKSFTSSSRRIKQFIDRERIFTRGASHEFRTPLTVIKMASDLLLAEPDLNPYSTKYANRIRAAVRDMEELIDAFLVLARETDNEFVDEHVVVSDMLENEIKAAQIFNQEKNLKIDLIENYPLELDTAQKVLSIVFGNLIRNAVIYTDKGGVTVTIEKDHVLVSDTGIGMCSEQVNKIFQPYYRANQYSRTPRKGYGVGLTIVKRLSNRFNWTVEVQSEVDVGTTFKLIFNDLL